MTRVCHALWLAALVGAASVGSARTLYQGMGVAEDPRWLRAQLRESYLQMEVEAQSERQDFSSSQTARDLLFVEPLLGLGVDGSIYHPNLLEFRTDLEVGLSWQTLRLDPPGGTRSSVEPLQRYHADLTLLREKPCVTIFSAEKDLTYADYDFFNRARVDRQRFGVATGWRQGPVPVAITAAHVEEDITGLSRPSTLDENTVAVSASNERASRNRTDLAYNLDDFRRRDDGSPAQTGLSQDLTLSDAEFWGAGDWVRLNSLLFYRQLSHTSVAQDSLQLGENLRLDHTPELESFYQGNFDTRSVGSSTTDAQSATAGLRHQLYESLASTVDLHGYRTESHWDGGTSRSRRYGVGVGEAYTKRLADWARLGVSYAGVLDQEENHAPAGDQVIIGERHTLTDGVPTFLHQPNALASTIVVTDPTGTIMYQPLLDYRVTSQGALTELQRVVGGRIANGGAVLVEYSAPSSGTGTYVSFLNQLGVRFDLLHGLASLYGRLNRLEHSGAANVVLQDYTDAVVGAELNHRWLRAGAEYENFDSNLGPYRAWRLYQTLSGQPAENLSLTLDTTQTWIERLDTGTRQNSYSVIGREALRVSSWLSWTAEGGVRFERGPEYRQDLVTARTGVEASYGQLTVRLTYEFEDETVSGQGRQRHYFRLRARRTF